MSFIKLRFEAAAKIRVMQNLDCRSLPNDSDSNSSFCNFVNYTHNVIMRVRTSLDNGSVCEFWLARADELLVELFNSSDPQKMFDLLTKTLDLELYVDYCLELERPDHFILGKEYKTYKKMNRDFSRSMMSLVIAIKEAVADGQIKDKIADLHRSILGKNGSHRTDRQEENHLIPEAGSMSSARLYFTIASVLIASETALAQEALTCAHENPDFCMLIEAAHTGNQRALRTLKDDLAGLRTALQHADHMVTVVLTKRESSEVHAALTNALDKELRVLLHFKYNCFKLSKEEEKAVDAKCEILYNNIGYVTSQLVLAVMEAEPDQYKKARIRSVYDSYLVKQPSQNNKWENRVYEMGKEILKIM
ncbi:unnamed protein product [Nippostrongylus brasiliensis]|uniref:ZFYVE26 n=1 Tax=Nippostrongylus brasiliensis TaxID=27835 RepID=A0A0N4Y006_NIPBR|nr:unnamed protein product [Nippostrongylus brasiliensis]